MDSCVPDLKFVNLGLQRRKELLEKQDFLRLQELYQSQGKIFGKILVDQMSPIEKILLKADKDREMPKENIYIAPIDRLREVIDPCKSPCRVNATTADLLKATTFDQILIEGTKLHEKLLEQHELKLEKAVNNNSQFERYEAEEKLRYALNEQESIYNEKFNRFRLKVQSKFDEKIAKIEKSYDKKYNKMMEEVVQDSEEKLEFLRLKMQREIDYLSNQLKEKQTIISEKPKIETVDKSFNVDFVSAAIRKFQEEQFIKQHSKETENMASVLNLVNCTHTEQKQKCDVMKKDYLNTLENLKNILKIMIDSFCSLKCLKNQNKEFTDTVKKFIALHDSAVRAITEFEENYRFDLCNFVMKPLCTFVLPERITQKYFCQCNDNSSSSYSEECSCSDKITPTMQTKFVKQIQSGLCSTSVFDNREIFAYKYTDIESQHLFATFVSQAKQNIVELVDMEYIIEHLFTTHMEEIIESVDPKNNLTNENIHVMFLDALNSHISLALSDYDFSWIRKHIVNERARRERERNVILDEESPYSVNLDGTKQYYFDYENRKKLPSYFIDGHGNKMFIYKELTKEELLEAYKKDDK